MEIGPQDDVAAAIPFLEPEDELVLRPGEYHGPWILRNGGTPDKPLVIRAKDSADRPRVLDTGRGAELCRIVTSDITIRGLAFGPTRQDVDAVRVAWGDFVTVEDCDFEGVGGIAVASNSRSTRALSIRRNRIVKSRATAIYIGCHSGTACALEEVLVEGNYIHGVDAPHPRIGYGVQFKLNSWGWIRDNVIVNTKGPGIMVYGATLPGRTSLIEGNAVMGSRRSGAIVLGGGPAIVRNNVVSGGARGGIRLEDYAGRGLLQGIAIAHNTVYDNPTGGILIQDGAPVTDIWIVNNAVRARAADPAYPRTGNGVRCLGNVDCSLTPCFEDPGRRLLSPGPGSPLIGRAVPRSDEWMPRNDFAGAPRGPTPAVGALEGPAPPIPLGFKGASR